MPTVILYIFFLSVPFRETPSYTNRRRVMPGPLPSPRSLLRSASDNNLNGDHDHIHAQPPREVRGRQGHSPVPSLRSLPAFGQQHSSLGEVSEVRQIWKANRFKHWNGEWIQKKAAWDYMGTIIWGNVIDVSHLSYVRVVMERSLTAVSRALAAPDPPIPAHLHYITCTKMINQFPDDPTATATLMGMALVEDSGL